MLVGGATTQLGRERGRDARGVALDLDHPRPGSASETRQIGRRRDIHRTADDEQQLAGLHVLHGLLEQRGGDRLAEEHDIGPQRATTSTARDQPSAAEQRAGRLARAPARVAARARERAVQLEDWMRDADLVRGRLVQPVDVLREHGDEPREASEREVSRARTRLVLAEERRDDPPQRLGLVVKAPDADRVVARVLLPQLLARGQPARARDAGARQRDDAWPLARLAPRRQLAGPSRMLEHLGHEWHRAQLEHARLARAALDVVEHPGDAGLHERREAERRGLVASDTQLLARFFIFALRAQGEGQREARQRTAATRDRATQARQRALDITDEHQRGRDDPLDHGAARIELRGRASMRERASPITVGPQRLGEVGPRRDVARVVLDGPLQRRERLADVPRGQQLGTARARVVVHAREYTTTRPRDAHPRPRLLCATTGHASGVRERRGMPARPPISTSFPRSVLAPYNRGRMARPKGEGEDDELAALRSDLADVRADLRDARADRDEARDEVKRLREEIKLAREERDAAREELARIKAEGVSSRRLSHDKLEIIKELQASIISTAPDIDDTLQALTEMRTGLKSIADSVELLASNAEESSSSILQMAAANDGVAESMFNLASSVEETAISIEEMTFSVREVAKNIEALSTTAEETSSAMNEMDISIQQVENNANETAQLSEEVVWAAEGGVDAINRTIEVINLIKTYSADAVTVISRLGQRIGEIGTILTVIDDVAEQTNLLALNAAIIAAQAGEHGKGFAVVADEIKDLAERSATSTKEISDIIKAVQRESYNAVEAVQRSSKSVDDGVRVSHQAEDSLKRISDSARRSTQMVREIARATVEQTKGSKQVTDAINVVATTVQQVATATSEQARGAEQIMKSAEKMKSITRHVERSTQEQTRGSRQITQAIETISEMVSQLSTAHQGQTQNADTIVARLSSIREAAQSQMELIERALDH